MLTLTTLSKHGGGKYISIASSLVVGIVLLTANESPISPFPPRIVSAQDSDEVAEIHGRLWQKNRVRTPQGTYSSAPVTNGSVFVTDTDLTKLYGEATTRGGMGPDTGFFQVTKLPANQDLLVLYYDATVPGYLQLEEIRLAPNETRELAPNDPNALITRLMTATDLLDAMQGLVNKHLDLALQAEDTNRAERLKAHLDKLSLPAEEEGPFEIEGESGGGLTGKTIGFIGAAAGGAGVAVAAASGGSDKAGITQPTVTTTTTSTVPSSSSNWITVSIYADRRWNNTTRNVAAGNKVRFRAWGTVTIDTDGTTATPDGSGQGNAGSSAVLPGAPLHGLICAWDPDGSTKFFVGSEATVTASIDGTIYCTVNEQPDRDSSYMDNSGAWSVEYTFMWPWD